MTLKTKFRRHPEDAAASTTTPYDVTDDVTGELANGDRAAAVAVIVAETTDNGSRNHNEDGCITTSPETDEETADRKQDDGMAAAMGNGANHEAERTTVKDESTPAESLDSEAYINKSYDSNDESLVVADDEQRARHDDFKSATSISIDETEPTTEETATAGDENVDAGPPAGIASTTTTTTNTTDAAEKIPLEGGDTSYDDNGNVEKQSISELIEAKNGIVDDGSGVTNTTETKKTDENLSSEGKSHDTEKESAAEETVVDDRLETASTTKTEANKTTEKKNFSLEEGKLSNAADVKSAATDETANYEVCDRRTEKESTLPPAPVVIVVEDLVQPAPVEQSADEVDHHGGVRQLAQRIDEAAAGSKRESTVTLRVKKQVSERAQRPVSTSYDFAMNEQQREWTLRASYSDYQALAKLLARYQGRKSRPTLCSLVHIIAM